MASSSERVNVIEAFACLLMAGDRTMNTIIEEAWAVAEQAAYDAWRDAIDEEEDALAVFQRTVGERLATTARCQAALRRAEDVHVRQCGTWAFFYDLFRASHPVD